MAGSRRSLLLLLETIFLFTSLFIPPTPTSAAGRWGFLPSATTGTSPQPAAPTPKSASPASAAYLDPHNQARSAVGVPPLTWSPTVERSAKRLVQFQRANQSCGFADLANSTYGTNQAMASYTPAPDEVVGLWVAEKKWYTHANNSCVQGHQCGTYTQVVWRNTTELGCAQAVCAGGSSITVCLYHPHGNIIGESPY